MTFTNQPKEKIVKFAKKVCLDHPPISPLIVSHDTKARTTIPFLRRFKADWATEAYLRRSLRNRKAHLKRNEDKRKAAGVDSDITFDDDLGFEDSQEGSLDEMDDE